MSSTPSEKAIESVTSHFGKMGRGKKKTMTPERRAALAEHMRRIGLANRGKRRTEQVTPTEPETPDTAL